MANGLGVGRKPALWKDYTAQKGLCYFAVGKIVLCAIQILKHKKGLKQAFALLFDKLYDNGVLNAARGRY
jgi:hypothetical protein